MGSNLGVQSQIILIALDVVSKGRLLNITIPRDLESEWSFKIIFL